MSNDIQRKPENPPAFPFGAISEKTGQPINGCFEPGMSLRDYFAAKAPINYEMVIAVWGEDKPNLLDDSTRNAFMAIWSMLRYEYPDAMLKERAKEGV